MSNFLLLPGDEGFSEILSTNMPPDLKGNNETNNRTAVMGVDGLLRSINSRAELEDYLYGGEYAYVMNEQEQQEEQVELIELYL